jgi:uncharacterized protein (TIGR02444 family)
MSAERTNPFWDYSYALHESKGIGPACIELQDRHGLDVNLILYCSWVAASGRGALDAVALRRAAGTVREWQKRVSSVIRDVRRLLKTDALGVPDELVEEFRKKLLDVEIESERISLDVLLTVAPVPDGARDDAARRGMVRDNIEGYFKLAGIVPDERDRAAIALIADAALAPLDRKR